MILKKLKYCCTIRHIHTKGQNRHEGQMLKISSGGTHTHILTYSHTHMHAGGMHMINNYYIYIHIVKSVCVCVYVWIALKLDWIKVLQVKMQAGTYSTLRLLHDVAKYMAWGAAVLSCNTCMQTVSHTHMHDLIVHQNRIRLSNILSYPLVVPTAINMDK